MQRASPPPSSVNWSSLPKELLASILRFLPLHDRARFRSVCRAWRSCTPSEYVLPSHRQLPFLMLPGDESRRAETHHFLSLAERGAVYHIPLPARRFVGSSSDGAWLVSVARTGKAFLLNPFSRVQVRLPPLFTLPGVQEFERLTPVVGDVTAYHFELREGTLAAVGWNYMSLRLLVKVSAWVVPPASSGVPTPMDYAAVGIHGEGTKLAFCRAGDESWTAMAGTSCPYTDVVCFNGRFHAVGTGGVVEAWDIGGNGTGPPQPGAVAPPLPCLRCRRRYLVVWSGPTGEHLLQVLMVAGRDDLRPDRFHVFRLQAATGGREGRWVEVKSLGADWALFLCRGRSACVTVRGFPECRGDCVYFVDDVWPWLTAVQGKGCQMGEYRLGGDGAGAVAWYSVSIWPPPIWFLPHLPDVEEQV